MERNGAKCTHNSIIVIHCLMRLSHGHKRENNAQMMCKWWLQKNEQNGQWNEKRVIWRQFQTLSRHSAATARGIYARDKWKMRWTMDWSGTDGAEGGIRVGRGSGLLELQLVKLSWRGLHRMNAPAKRKLNYHRQWMNESLNPFQIEWMWKKNNNNPGMTRIKNATGEGIWPNHHNVCTLDKNRQTFKSWGNNWNTCIDLHWIWFWVDWVKKKKDDAQRGHKIKNAWV